MSTPEEAEMLRGLGRFISEVVSQIYEQEMGFFLCVGPMGNNPDAIADYIGNIRRDTGIEWLRETADRLELRQDIPEPEHSA